MITKTPMKAELVETKNTKYTVVEVTSMTNPDRKYRVDVTNGRCSCPAWIFSKGGRKVCKHLKSLGYKEVGVMTEIVAPATASLKEML